MARWTEYDLPLQQQNSTDDNKRDITQLLVRWSQGDKAALEELTPVVYDELHRLAKVRLSGENHAQTLQPTALVNEAYLKLAENTHLLWQNRTHFFAFAANIMRRILIDNARKRTAEKRGAGGINVPLNEEIDAANDSAPDILDLDLALHTLAKKDERKSRVIELKYFGGLTTEEISQVTGLSVATVGRDLRLAHAWLLRELASAHPK